MMSNGASQSCESGTGKPSAPIFDFADEMGFIKTVSCEPRPCPEMKKFWEQLRKNIVDNNR